MWVGMILRSSWGQIIPSPHHKKTGLKPGLHLCGLVVAVNPRDIFGVKDDVRLTRELLVDLADDQIEVGEVADKVQLVSRDDQHRTERESFIPLLIQVIQSFQVVRVDILLKFAPTLRDAF